MSHPSICVGDLTTIKKNTKYEKNAFKICVRFRFCTNLTHTLFPNRKSAHVDPKPKKRCVLFSSRNLQ